MTHPLNDFPEIPSSSSTLVELLRYRAAHQPSQLAFTFLQDGETEDSSLTYRELDRLSRAIASQLQALGVSGERALLLYPPGLDYLAAFFGCLYAGVVAVPAYPPRNQRNTPRIKAVVADAQAAIALTTTAILSKVQSLLAEETDPDVIQWLTTDNLASGIEEGWQEPFINRDTLAFLQYTSGSTGTPKGAMLSHGNLLHNATMTYRFMEHSPSSKFVSWLPTYHDMGLIGGILQPLYGGFPCILMPPASFLQRPYRWLQIISQYQATTSGGPNFAYELCIHKITPEQRETLDLSRWSVAFNGAEPIRQDTLERFAAAFASCGFRQQAFYPCYGMAEATLMVSGSVKAALPVIKTVQGVALERNQVVEAGAGDENVRTLVGCGQTLAEQQIVIVHPDLTRCLPDEVGEIWVSGPSVGNGYWNRTLETEQTFCAHLSDTGEGPFLRTGDLGFLHNGELFITGRAKDLIIIRGRNLYPQDIELTAERSHPALRLGSGAAFSVEIDDEERLVVVQELEFRQKPNVEEVTKAIRQAIAEEHEVQAYAVVLIKAGTIPKTSSGKIQRRACRADFLAGNLDVIGSSILDNSYSVQNENSLTRDALLAVEPEERQLLLKSYLQGQVVRVLKVVSSQLDFQQPLSSFGLDSLMVFELKNRIEVDLGVDISVADFFEGASIPQLATQVLDQLKRAAPTASVPLCKVQKTTAEHPLSFAQQRLWFVNQLGPNTPAYNIPIAFNLTGRLNMAVLTRSINEIIKRHEVLRTSFVTVDGKPVQVIASVPTFTLSEVDLRQLPDAERQTEAQRLTIEEATRPFDLAHKPLLRAKLLHLAQEEFMLLLTLHHIVADGWSVGVLIRELAAFYEAFLTGNPSPLPELPFQYVDFAYWQRQWLQEKVLKTQLAYWKQQLSGNLPVLELPTDRPRPPIQTFRGGQQKLVLPKALSEAIKMLSHREGVTLFMTLLAAFKTLLYRYTGQDDIIVGSPIANRNRPEIENLIGFFVNTLVLRTNISDNLSFEELLGRVRKVAIEAYVHQDLPFEKLVEELQPSRDLSYNPLFQVMFVLQNPSGSTCYLPDLTLQTLEVDSQTAKFDLFLSMMDTEQGLIGALEYNTDLFNADAITRMLGHFQTLLEGIVAAPDQCLSNLPLLTPTERLTLLVSWNDTQTDYPQDKCVHQLFEAQVERTPDAIAVVFENQQLSYRELNNRANFLAHYLQQLGVKPEVLVGICMERSLEMVVGLLAILKAGGAYVPLDPAYPKERLAFMLADAQVAVLLTQQRLVERLPGHGAHVVNLDTDWEVIAQQSKKNPESGVTADNLAYAIYTSGSTGRPKGVAIEHRGTVALLNWARDIFATEHLTGVLASTSICFDLSVFELFVPLSWGGKVILALDALHLPVLSAAKDITLINTVPSAIAELLRVDGVPASVRTVNLAGEPLDNRLVQRIYQQDTIQQVFNLYGPSEDTSYSTFALVKKGVRKSPTIGRPIANTQVYVLNRHLKAVPIGVPGELYIGGDGLARGYLNRPELTSEKFIPNPFSDEPGTRLYKTGDLAHYLPDGNIEFLGRLDHQVKLRGFRIELGEIEAVLRQHPKVQETVVLAREDMSSDQRLVAYIVPNQESAPTINELRGYLKEQLAEYMVPSAFVLLAALPLTLNGKVDRRALPAPENLRPELAKSYQAPRSEVERAIASVWQAVLRLEKVGVNDNFFDLGGHSLLMVQVNSKLRAVFNQDLSIVEMFQNPTIESLAQCLSQKPEAQPSFGPMRDRAQKQIEAINRQKQLLMKQGRKTNG